MVEVILYENSGDFWESFKKLRGDTPLRVIAPNPRIADNMRRVLPGDQYLIQTIPSFIDDIANDLGFDTSLFKKKSDLFFSLGIWAKENHSMSFNEFFSVFNIFTELRSITVHRSLAESILDEFLPKIKSYVLGLYDYFEEKNWIDEHLLYEKLSQKIHHLHEKSGFVFWGFRHMSGTQVDFLTRLGESFSVYIPYRKSIFERSWSSDWIKWFETNESSLLKLGEKKSPPSSLRYIEFLPGKLSLYLHQFFEKDLSSRSIILGQSTLNDDDILTIPHQDIAFKLPFEFWGNSLKKIENILIRKRGKPDEVVQIIDRKIECILRENKVNFQALKVLSSVKKLLKTFKGSERMGDFTWRLIFEKLKLDLPRVNMVSSFSKEKKKYSLHSLSDLDDPNISNEPILILSEDYVSFRSESEQIFSESIEKKISCLAPMRRSEVDNYHLEEDLKEIFGDKNPVIFLEKDYLTKEPNWKELLDQFTLERIKLDDFSLPLGKNSKGRIQEVRLEGPSGGNSFSPSRIQSYLDCELAYYYKYVYPIFPDYSFEEDLEPRELGSLEHEIISSYCESNSSFSRDRLKDISLDYLNQHIVKNNKRISQVQRGYFLDELILLSERGVNFYFDLKNIFNFSDLFIFEREVKKNVSDYLKRGFIDASLFNESQIILIDFKRSPYSIPTAREIFELMSVQILFYLNILDKSYMKENIRYCIGYFCLRNPSRSLLWADDETKDQLEEMGYRGIQKKSELLWNSFGIYPRYEEEIIKKIKSQKIFKANPRKKEVCTYCDLKSICDRGLGDG